MLSFVLYFEYILDYPFREQLFFKIHLLFHTWSKINLLPLIPFKLHGVYMSFTMDTWALLRLLKINCENISPGNLTDKMKLGQKIRSAFETSDCNVCITLWKLIFNDHYRNGLWSFWHKTYETGSIHGPSPVESVLFAHELMVSENLSCAFSVMFQFRTPRFLWLGPMG